MNAPTPAAVSISKEPSTADAGPVPLAGPLTVALRPYATLVASLDCRASTSRMVTAPAALRRRKRGFSRRLEADVWKAEVGSGRTGGANGAKARP